jgi:hypothetical protein
MYQVRAIAVFPVFRLLTDFVCLLIYDLILLLPLSTQHYTENYGLNSKSDPISGAPRVKNWR